MSSSASNPAKSSPRTPPVLSPARSRLSHSGNITVATKRANSSALSRLRHASGRSKVAASAVAVSPGSSQYPRPSRPVMRTLRLPMASRRSARGSGSSAGASGAHGRRTSTGAASAAAGIRRIPSRSAAGGSRNNKPVALQGTVGCSGRTHWSAAISDAGAAGSNGLAKRTTRRPSPPRARPTTALPTRGAGRARPTMTLKTRRWRASRDVGSAQPATTEPAWSWKVAAYSSHDTGIARVGWSQMTQGRPSRNSSRAALGGFGPQTNQAAAPAAASTVATRTTSRMTLIDRRIGRGANSAGSCSTAPLVP